MKTRIWLARLTYSQRPPKGFDLVRFDVAIFKKTKLPQGGPAVARPPSLSLSMTWILFKNPVLGNPAQTLVTVPVESKPVVLFHCNKLVHAHISFTKCKEPSGVKMSPLSPDVSTSNGFLGKFQGMLSVLRCRSIPS